MSYPSQQWVQNSYFFRGCFCACCRYQRWLCFLFFNMASILAWIALKLCHRLTGVWMRWKMRRCHPPANHWSLNVPSVGSNSKPPRAESVTWSAVLWRWMFPLRCFFRQCSCRCPRLVMHLYSFPGKLVKIKYADYCLCPERTWPCVPGTEL